MCGFQGEKRKEPVGKSAWKPFIKYIVLRIVSFAESSRNKERKDLLSVCMCEILYLNAIICFKIKAEAADILVIIHLHLLDNATGI